MLVAVDLCSDFLSDFDDGLARGAIVVPLAPEVLPLISHTSCTRDERRHPSSGATRVSLDNVIASALLLFLKPLYRLFSLLCLERPISLV